MTKRFFYRCNDCLTVIATEAKIAENAVCDACEGTFEYMGATSGAFITTRHEVCACDARCTSARGPVCDCPCGGENHGRETVVPVYTHLPIPRVMVPKNAATKAQEFRSLCEQFKAKWNEQFGDVAERRRNGEWLSPALFQYLLRGKNIWAEFAHIKHMRTHARTKKLAKLLEVA